MVVAEEKGKETKRQKKTRQKRMPTLLSVLVRSCKKRLVAVKKEKRNKREKGKKDAHLAVCAGQVLQKVEDPHVGGCKVPL